MAKIDDPKLQSYVIEVKVCPTCDNLFFDSSDTCWKCEVPTTPLKIFRRWEVERFAFLLLVFFVTINGFLYYNTFENIFSSIGILIITSYYLGNYFLSLPKFREYIEPENNDIPDDYFSFSLKKFGSEFLYVFVPVGTIGLGYLALSIFRNSG